MSDKIEIQGKTVEAAVSEALLQMGARRDEVEIKVLEEPKSGFMGFLGGRDARVLVRRKRSRGRGGSGNDYRVEDDNYQAHNLSEGRSRGGSRRRPSGGSPRGRDGSRDAAREPKREEKTGTRRGSRGRGGRNRNQDAAAQGSARGPAQEPKQEQKQEQKRSQSRNQSRDQKRDQSRDQNRDQNRSQPNERRPRNRRNQVRDKQSRDGRSQAPQESSRPITDAREDSTPRAETPIRPLKTEPVKANESRNAPAPRPEPKPVEKKEEVVVAKPVKPRRGFGGLGSRLKEKRTVTQEAQTPQPEQAAPATPPARPAPTASPVARERSPRPERSDRGRRSPSYSSARVDEEVVLSGIKGARYAKALGPVTDEGLDEALTELTDGMLARAGFPCRCETHPGEYRQIKVTTDDASAGMLIGRHGQTVDAVEHLVERMASNAIDARARINLDINNYRMQREESLGDRVAEAAGKIQETGRAFHMEPMSARERRIVHMEAAKLDGLRTFTMEGSGGKHVVIALDDEARNDAQPTADGPGDGAEDTDNFDT